MSLVSASYGSVTAQDKSMSDGSMDSPCRLPLTSLLQVSHVRPMVSPVPCVQLETPLQGDNPGLGVAERSSKVFEFQRTQEECPASVHRLE
jgi:hypothetical protein